MSRFATGAAATFSLAIFKRRKIGVQMFVRSSKLLHPIPTPLDHEHHWLLHFYLLSIAFCLAFGFGNPLHAAERSNPIEIHASRVGDCEKNGMMNPGIVSDIQSIPAQHSKFCAIILSVPQLIVDWLENGSKVYEYRKTHPADPISHIIFYNTTTKRLHGFATVRETLFGPPKLIVDQTWRESGTSAENLMEYFGPDRPIGYATRIEAFSVLHSQTTLAEMRQLDPGFQAPQGYVFLERFPNLHALVKAQIIAATPLLRQLQRQRLHPH